LIYFAPLSEIRDITIQHLPNHHANQRKPAWTLINVLHFSILQKLLSDLP